MGCIFSEAIYIFLLIALPITGIICMTDEERERQYPDERQFRQRN